MDEDDVFFRVGARIVEECGRRGIQGTFAMVDLVTAYTRSQIRWMMVGTISPLKLNRPGKEDSNSLAIVLTKLAMVIAHQCHTGVEAPLKGEVPWKGGRISEDREFGYAFSGGTADEDDELMQLAEEFHKSLK
jgi:hypothetical protein